MKRKFLIVDDDPMIINAVERLVKKEPYEFHWFKSPIEALEKIDAIRPQVILSDQRMPQMDGIEFMKKVRKKLPNTARMILSGYCLPETAENALARKDVMKFITKPWDNDTLLQEIRYAFIFQNKAVIPKMVRCDICGNESSAKTIQVHKAYRLCLRCKKKAEPLTDENLHAIAGASNAKSL